MPPNALKRANSVAWEQAARDAQRELRRRDGDGLGNRKSQQSWLSRKSKRASPGDAMECGGEFQSGVDDSEAGEEPQADFADIAPDPTSPLSALRLKAMAAKLRKRVHKESEAMRKASSRPGHGSYASLENAGARGEDEQDVASDGGNGNWDALMSIFMHPFTCLLIAFPLGVASHLLEWGQVTTFWLNIVALIPLAKILGDGTEELAAAIRNDTISGLLNATLGNAVELILTVQTLRKGLIDVVKATLLGSILSNILLVLGTSFLLGGLVGSPSVVGKHHVIYRQDYEPSMCTMEKEQIFSSKSALVSMGMQLLACMTCTLPTLFNYGATPENMSEAQFAHQQLKLLEVSRLASIIIMLAYVAYVFFQLVTHKRMLTVDEGAEDDDDDGEEDGMSAGFAILLMGVTTCIIAVCSEMLVGAIEHVVKSSHVSADFIGIVLLPFAGNACEHASAIRFAMQDRPGLSIGIAVGSSTQIALFVVPFAVVMGWLLDQPMDLAFGELNMTVMLLSVLVALALVIDGRSNWLKGFMLCTAYVFEGILYWYSASL